MMVICHAVLTFSHPTAITTKMAATAVANAGCTPTRRSSRHSRCATTSCTTTSTATYGQ